MSYAIYKVGVVGGGTMGRGIAALLARHGIPTVLKEATEECARETQEKITGRLKRLREDGKIKAHEFEEQMSLTTVTSRSEDLSDVQLLIEAVPEILDLKLEVFKEFDKILPKEVIMVSNTSSLPVTKLAEATTRRDRVAGMHFFNPPMKMPLVEVVRGKYTSEETVKAVNDFATGTLEKKIICVEDRPGFIVNCLLVPYLNEAALGVEEALLAPAAIDEEARKHGWMMGPFTLLDYVGIDVAVFVARFLTESYGDRMKMGTLFEEMLKLGRLGDKVGVGFYSNDESVEPIGNILKRLYPNRKTDVTVADIFDRMMYGVLNEAVCALENEIASFTARKGVPPSEKEKKQLMANIETGATLGIAFPGSSNSAINAVRVILQKTGPLHTIDSMGASALVERLERFERDVGSRFAPRPLLREMANKREKFFSSW